MEQSLVDVAREYGIIIDEREGLIEITPSVIMFHGVSLNCHLSRGNGRQKRYIALYNDGFYSIESYENYITF